MRHLGLGVGHKRDEHDGEPMEVDPLNLRVHNAPDRPDERANYNSEPEIDRNTACQDREEEQEGEDSKEEDDLDGDDEELVLGKFGSKPIQTRFETKPIKTVRFGHILAQTEPYF